MGRCFLFEAQKALVPMRTVLQLLRETFDDKWTSKCST